MQKKLYKIASKKDSRKIAEFLSKDGQLLLPFLDLTQVTQLWGNKKNFRC